jgi:hypothetical protein
MPLNFDSLLAKACLDYPEEIDLNFLLQPGENANRYTIKGLGLVCDDIADRYIGTPDEIIFRNLHSAIYSVLHGVGAFVTGVKLSTLRPEAIRIRFEKHLRHAMNMPDLGYSLADIELAKKYFDINDC